MNAKPNETPAGAEERPESSPPDADLVEVGAVSETQGSVFGPKPDNGVGLIFN